MPNSPEHQLFTDLSWNVGRDLTVAVDTDSFSHWYVDASNTTSVDGYTLLKARVAWRFSMGSWAAELSVQGRNLTGVEYIAFTEPDPDGNSYQPGPEEELFTGLRISFP